MILLGARLLCWRNRPSGVVLSNPSHKDPSVFSEPEPPWEIAPGTVAIRWMKSKVRTKSPTFQAFRV